MKKPEDQLLDNREIAEMFDVSIETVYKWESKERAYLNFPAPVKKGASHLRRHDQVVRWGIETGRLEEI